jgi:hypothetical protein
VFENREVLEEPAGSSGRKRGYHDPEMYVILPLKFSGTAALEFLIDITPKTMN